MAILPKYVAFLRAYADGPVPLPHGRGREEYLEAANYLAGLGLLRFDDFSTSLTESGRHELGLVLGAEADRESAKFDAKIEREAEEFWNIRH